MQKKLFSLQISCFQICSKQSAVALNLSLLFRNELEQDNSAVNETLNVSNCQSWVSQENTRETDAKMILNLQSQSNVSNTVANSSVEICSNLVNSVTNTLKKEVQSFLTKPNIELNPKEYVDLMSKFNELAEPFNGLKTKNQQFTRNILI